MSAREARSPVVWRMAEVIARTLDAGERDAVLGDLLESANSNGRALREVLGLVARRELEAWCHGLPWFALLGLVVPLGFLLSLVSRDFADGSAIAVWFYANNWDGELLRAVGFWYGLVHSVPGLLLMLLALACWSWTGGLLVASSSRRTIRVSGGIFCAVLLSVELMGLPRALGGFLLLDRARDFKGNAAVFAVEFYRVLFPWVVQVILVLLPALAGMRHRLRFETLSHVNRTVLWVFVLLAVFALGAQSSTWWQMRTWTMYPPRLPLLPSLLPLAAFGPVGYVLATLSRRECRVPASPQCK